MEKAHIALTNYLRKKQQKAVPLEKQKEMQEDYHSVNIPDIFIDTALLKSYLKTNADQSKTQLKTKQKQNKTIKKNTHKQ